MISDYRFQSALHSVEVVAGLVVEWFSADLSGREHRALELACGVAGCSVMACGWAASPGAVLVALAPFYAALGTARICFRALLSGQAKRAGGGVFLTWAVLSNFISPYFTVPCHPQSLRCAPKF